MVPEPQLYLEAAKIFTYFGLAFFIAMWWAPFLIELLRHLKFWKKDTRKFSTTGEELTVTKQFYKENEQDKKVPRAGGVLIWATALFISLIFWTILKLAPDYELTQFLNFVDRRETFIPLGALFASAILGLVDDVFAVLPAGGNYFAGGLKLSQRMIGVVAIGLAIGWWFHARIGDEMHFLTLPLWDSAAGTWQNFDLSSLNLPFDGGILIIPITILIILSLWTTSIIDGFDGLAAGVFIPVYLCFLGLAFYEGAYDIATFLAVITGALVAYLWFNIPPARFYMGETGSMSLLVVIGVVAMLLDKIYVLPIACLILFLTSGSAALQVFSKKVFKKKVLLAAPLHHHLEAKGWLRYQVTMRYWLISMITSVLGFVFGLIIG